MKKSFAVKGNRCLCDLLIERDGLPSSLGEFWSCCTFTRFESLISLKLQLGSLFNCHMSRCLFELFGGAAPKLFWLPWPSGVWIVWRCSSEALSNCCVKVFWIEECLQRNRPDQWNKIKWNGLSKASTLMLEGWLVKHWNKNLLVEQSQMGETRMTEISLSRVEEDVAIL